MEGFIEVRNIDILDIKNPQSFDLRLGRIDSIDKPKSFAKFRF